MKNIKYTLLLLLSFSLMAEELKVVAQSFESDESKGFTTFKGDVHIKKGQDELNASQVIIYTDKDREPSKFVADGNVSFVITTENNDSYVGVAGKVVYLPKKKEYEFFKDVHLRQINEHKEINGEKVMVNLVDGKAFAEGKKNEPVIMIFKIDTNTSGLR